MEEKEINHKCNWCGSTKTTFEQDTHHKSLDGVINGVVTCRDCNQISFWYFKTKEFCTILPSGNLAVKTNSKVVIVEQWDGPMTSFLYDHIEHASQKTKRPIESYYTTYILGKDINDVKVHRLDFSETLAAIAGFEGKVIKEIKKDVKIISKPKRTI